MSTRDRMYELTTPEEVDQFIERYPTCAFFKAGGCHKTMQGFGYVETALASRENIHLGFVRVIENRPASNHIAEITSITHQSPQFILMVDGKIVYDVDNWDITPEVLEATLNQYFGEVSAEVTHSQSAGNLDIYVDLLKQLIDGQVEEDDFAQKWLTTFQTDSSLRSQEEFALLNSLFGDVDAAISLGVPQSIKDKTLAEKAEQLLTIITTQ